MHFFSALFRIFADNMQILLASAKIMNDRSATKGDACQSKKVSVHPDIGHSGLYLEDLFV